LAEQGVHHSIDYHHHHVPTVIKGLTGGRGLDMVLDPLGGRSFAQSYTLLAPLGRLILFGVSRLSQGPRRHILKALWQVLRLPRFHPISLLNKNLSVIGVNLGHLWDHTALLSQGMQTLLDLHEQGHIQPVIAQTFPLAEAAAAHRCLQARQNIGKVLLLTAS
jgi:NADPH:quinone reductase-like Zn-dependent oxidoreductase